jgi:hypothetical protein
MQLSRRRLKMLRPPKSEIPESRAPAPSEGELSEDMKTRQIKIILQRLVSNSREDALEALEYLCLSFAGRPEFGDLLLEIRFLMLDTTRLEWDKAATAEVMQKVLLWAQSLPM